MTITVPSEFQDSIDQAVASGRYRSEAELLRDALRLLQDHDRRWDALRNEIESGLYELDRGEKTIFDVEDKRRGRDRIVQRTANS